MIELSDAEIARCEEHGAMVVAGYANNEKAASRAVSGVRGIETNVKKQAEARMAELAAVKWCGLQAEALNWGPRPDGGWDFKWDGVLIDVKHRPKMHRKFILWSLDVNHCYWEKHFDILFGIRGGPKVFVPQGWVDKDRFFQLRHVAPDGPVGGLDPGTWYMTETDLYPASDLKKNAAALAIRMGIPFAYVDGKWPSA